jgi:hypothetical protein
MVYVRSSIPEKELRDFNEGALTPGEYYSLEVVLGGSDCVSDPVNVIDANPLYRERQRAMKTGFASGKFQVSALFPA